MKSLNSLCWGVQQSFQRAWLASHNNEALNEFARYEILIKSNGHHQENVPVVTLSAVFIDTDFSCEPAQPLTVRAGDG